MAGYGRTFGVLGHQASAVLAVPYIWGDISGNVFEEARSVTRSGLGDIKLRLAVNLIGGEAMTPKEFMKRTPKTTLGASLSISAPTGQYDPDKLINIGTNRWAFKPEIGLTIPHGRWMFDVFAGVWLFSANPDFFGGVHREQDPMPTLQGHVSYTFRPQLWLALDSTYYFGGETSAQWCSRGRPEGKFPRRPHAVIAGGKGPLDQIQLEQGRDRAPRQQLHHLRRRPGSTPGSTKQPPLTIFPCR